MNVSLSFVSLEDQFLNTFLVKAMFSLAGVNLLSTTNNIYEKQNIPNVLLVTAQICE